jgi:zinc transport system ATP-binding protein
MRLNMALLKVQNLSLGYDSHAIVENLNFTVNTGDYLCIVGENGSGKSTLMKTLLHLQEPISGQILTGDGLKKNEIGYLPQQTIVQKDFPASVREIVLSGCQGRSLLRPFYSK